MEEHKLLKKKRKAILEGNKVLRAALCTDLGEFYMINARYEEAIEEYTELADVYLQLGKKVDYARANRIIGEAYMFMGSVEKALEFQNIYLKIAKEENDKLEEQRALATIGHTYLTSYLNDSKNNTNDLNSAHKYFMKSLMVCDNLTDISKHEHMDMSARLFANLGVVHEYQKNYPKGIELMEKSIKICKTYDLYDQLERSYIQLGSLYSRLREYDKAMTQFNLAIEVAGCLKDKTSRIVTSLMFKSEVLIALSDFRAAKDVLMKAYKMKSPNSVDHETVEQNLKVVAAMCYAEDSLLTTSETDYKTRKKLYEKMGDGACELKAYSLGIKYYEKMLEAATKSGDTQKDLSPCYISLAQTYKDNAQYDLALTYFQKEYNLCRNEVKEAVVTLLDIAETMELAKKDWIEIEIIYKMAYSHCKSAKDDRLKAKVLSRHVGMLRKANRTSEVDNLEKELFTLNYNSLSDSEGSQIETTPNIGDEICISDITDISDSSDKETDLDKPRLTRNKSKTFVVKKNNKGETQLHTACISGKIDLVKKLIQQKHPINIRDNCGWLPIHEACLHGFLDIVELLVDSGAAVNDRGGTECGGTTPIHDASVNGHLDIVDFLLKHGASSVSKDDNGNTPLALLKQWKENNEIDEEYLSLYNDLVERMSKDLENAGQSEQTQKNVRSVCAYERSVFSQGKTDGNRRKNSRTIGRYSSSKLRKDLYGSQSSSSSSRLTPEVFESDSNSCESVKGNEDYLTENATAEYKNVMKSLRYKSQDLSKKRKSEESLKISAHVSADDFVDENWLEDDLGINNANKKRKTVLTEDVFNTIQTKKRSFERISSSNSLKSDKSNTLNSAKENDDMDDDDMDDFVRTFQEDSDSSRDSFGSRSKKRQISLTSTGFTYQKTRRSDTRKNSTQQQRKHQLKVTDFSSQKSVTDFDRFGLQMLNDPVLSVDVRIDGKLYRVPIMLSEINSKTIKWLAEEASKRYARKEFARPVLDLETKNGAVLADDDFVGILFPAGNVQSEEVQARIVKWVVPSLAERYKESCSSFNVDVREEVLEILQISSTVVDLSSLRIREKHLMPLCKALNHQSNLSVLNLSGNWFSTESMLSLCHSLQSLSNLTALNLSMCNIDSEMLKLLADSFVKNQQAPLENLASLNLSFNPLTDSSLKSLVVLTAFLKLEHINLSGVDFSSDHFSNKDLDLNLKMVKEFNVSYNYLKTEQFEKILTWLNAGIVENLNVSNNYPYSSGITREIVKFLKNSGNTFFKLKVLNLSRCNVKDEEIEELLSIFEYSEGLENLNLSYNTQLSVNCLRKILKHSSLIDLDVTGCDNILVGIENDHEILELLKKSILNNFRITIPDNFNINCCDTLLDIWKNKHDEVSDIIQNINYLHLTVKKNQ